MLRKLVEKGLIPEKAEVDALHIATAASHGMDYLLTWNCKHIANAEMQTGVARLCLEAGFKPPVICTPEELYAKALELFRNRPDKDWGLVDCVSIIVMQEQELTESLTTDKHFEQAGFRALLREE